MSGRIDLAADNVAPVSPEVMEALVDANAGVARPYGADQISDQLHGHVAELLDLPSSASFAVGSGVAANALALATLVASQGKVYCTPTAHIRISEHGAPAFHSGAELVPVPDDGLGRMDPQALEALVDRQPPPPGSVVTLTDLTEDGTVLGGGRAHELQRVARRHGMAVHLDGARLLASAASVGRGDVTESIAALRAVAAGFDAISLGVTKNGGMGADVVVLADNARSARFVELRDRGAHRTSKMRFLSAQVTAMLTSTGWVGRAAHAQDEARALAELLEQVPGVRLARPVEANHLFVDLGPGGRERLASLGWHQYPWDAFGPDVVRVVTHWATERATVTAFAEDVRRAVEGSA